MNPLSDQGPRGSELASWTPLLVLLGTLAALLLVLAVRARGSGRPLLGVPARLEARLGVPGWAATTLLFGVFGLLVAGSGFRSDVAWHVALGRDEALFTAPHTSILIGLVLIASAPVAGGLVALLDRPAGPTWSGTSRLPPSLGPLAVLGVAALCGFPLDELWHRAYGIDVTMWSPPHLLMIIAASLSGLALWLVLADAGVRPRDSRTARGLHLLTALLSLLGLSSVQGEFSFGVPQWQQLYHPVLFCLAAGVGLVLVRLVHGPGWTLGLVVVLFLLELADGGSSPVPTRAPSTYLGAAVAVELAALALGTSRRLRFALASGVGIATVGLAVEWLWNQDAAQPWNTSLLPEAVVVGGLAALAGSVLAAALAGALRPTGCSAPPVQTPLRAEHGVTALPRAATALALVAAVTALAVPAPRTEAAEPVTAAISLTWTDPDRAVVDVSLTPADAAVEARWFFLGSWQWGGRTTAHMRNTGPGEYTSGVPVELAGRAKALLRLHRGSQMLAVPVRLPADPAYGLAETPAEARTATFTTERRYLQREASDQVGPLATLVHVLVLALATTWLVALTVAAGRVSRRNARPVHGGLEPTRSPWRPRPRTSRRDAALLP